ncbi:ATP-binding protein [Actinoplanes bogorensis]|uniref:ATP-binding protein n=1 Tax=Paractinoplanes bogorensis TaxID=1610840 RepID=A0ABS5YYI8_9ACTN|nr:ATP-binding protein [Actinoplanes bogorensis]MBU2668453.1 ATP-binding protein [Actinoplanes bogorensis]
MAEFVGRRAELRELLGAACPPGLLVHGVAVRGVVVHGVEGIGKTRLAAELLRRLDDRETVRVPGAATVEELVTALGEPRAVTLVIDDLATVPRGGGRAEPVDPAVAGFLAAWVREPGPRRLVITSRYPVTLPGRTHEHLAELRLGPLTPGDAVRLMRSLPGLAPLSTEQQTRAWALCGGRPRALEDLDTLLCHGAVGFAEVAERLETVLAANGIGDPAGWASSWPQGGPLAEAVTSTVDDVLTQGLLEVRHHASRAGDTASRLGDAEEASGHRSRALAIDERLGERAGPAGWDQLGLAGDDPVTAERQLRRALAVDAERGNRAGMASGLHRLGLLCTLTGRLPAAVALHCRAFVVEFTIDAPLELAELSRLRAALGDAAFRRAAGQVLPARSMNGLARMLDDFNTEHAYN